MYTSTHTHLQTHTLTHLQTLTLTHLQTLTLTHLQTHTLTHLQIHLVYTYMAASMYTSTHTACIDYFKATIHVLNRLFNYIYKYLDVYSVILSSEYPRFRPACMCNTFLLLSLLRRSAIFSLHKYTFPLKRARNSSKY